ncbi:hypothetical protein [Bartonella koehlerae]|uniref:hypothetical protein n=1 Tax=Bartonella koehlerae TaxID=92181 RepID=UPI001FD897EF|nr:hypothetical protein [Bartonella koehlerae]
MSTLHYEQTEHARAKFIVNPRFSNKLIDCVKTVLPFSRTVTPSNLMKALDKGYLYLKFFQLKRQGVLPLYQL